MRKRTTSERMGGVLALLLFAVFAVCILSVLTTGAGVYRRLAERDDRAYTQRTAERFIAAKVRQGENAQSVAAEAFAGTDTVTLRQDLGGIALLTQIYCHDGWLRELFHMEGSGLRPEDGEKILPMEALSAEERDGLLWVELTHSDGSSQMLVLALDAGTEGQA